MATVAEINQAFIEKGLNISLPLPPHLAVRHMEVLEKKSYAGGLSLLLSLRYVDDQGKEVSDLFLCQGTVDIKKVRKALPPRPRPQLKSSFLPLREKATFDSEAEAREYLARAIGHLLQDKGYQAAEPQGSDLYFQQEGRGFCINLALRCDETALERAKGLIEVRRQRGSAHDYGLVVRRPSRSRWGCPCASRRRG